MKSDIQKSIAAVMSDLELLRRELSSRPGLQTAHQRLLDALRRELNFVEQGGYANVLRPPLIFEDSPICPNYPAPSRAHPCADCVLMMLIPKQHQEDKNPCRHIPLNSQGETLGLLYSKATERELHWEIRQWLRVKVAELQMQCSKSSYCCQSS